MDNADETGLPLSPIVATDQTKQPVHESSILLPPEILSLVCGFIPKQKLKRVRQVSKTWERAAVPYLFDKVFISQNLADFCIAKLVIRRFQHYIRILVFSPVYYADLDRQSFEEEFSAISDIDSDIEDTTNADIHHSDYAFKLYRIARKNQHEDFQNGSTSAYLTFALASLPNVRKIILTDTFSSRSMSRESLQLFQPRTSKACPFKNCDLEATDHLPSAVLQTGFSRPGYTNPWRIVLSALATTNADVKELTMEPREIESRANTAAFSMSPGNLGRVKLCFGSLTKIRLSLFVGIEQLSTKHTRNIHQNVAKLLRSAVNLNSLSLDLVFEYMIDKPEYSTVKEILGRCKFPKLISLNLAFLTSSDLELIGLLKHSRSLEHVTIDCHDMTEGSWARVADWIRASLPLLKHAELNHLCGGFDERWQNYAYSDLYGQVGNFLFAQGENPFTTKSLEKYHADIQAKRQVINSSGGLNFKGAYTEYH